MIFKLRYKPENETEYTEIEVHPYDQRANSINYEFDETIAEARPKLSKPLVFVNELKEGRSEASFFVNDLISIETEIYIDIYNDTSELLMTGYFYGRDIEINSNGSEYLKASVKLTTFDKYTNYILKCEDDIDLRGVSKNDVTYKIIDDIEFIIAGGQQVSVGIGVVDDKPFNTLDKEGFYDVEYNIGIIITLGVSDPSADYGGDIANRPICYVYSRYVRYVPIGSDVDMTGWTEIGDIGTFTKYYKNTTAFIPNIHTYLSLTVGDNEPSEGYVSYFRGKKISAIVNNPEFNLKPYYGEELYCGTITLTVKKELYNLLAYTEYTNKYAMNLKDILNKSFETMNLPNTILSNYCFNDDVYYDSIDRKRDSDQLYLIDIWNVVRPLATKQRDDVKFKIKDIMDDLYSKYGLKWFIHDGIVYLEHEESFDNLLFLNIENNTSILDRYSYKTNGKELSQEDTYEEITGYRADSIEQIISYSNKNSLLSSKKNINQISTNVICSDIDGMIFNGDDSDGLIILECDDNLTVTFDSSNVYKGQNISNKPSYTFVNDRSYNRSQDTGILEYDGNAYNFTKLPIKLRENITIFDGVKPYSVIGHIKDNFGIGFIKKFEAGFNGLVTLELIYR